MRNYYQSQLDLIDKNIKDMGLMLENEIKNSVLCLTSNDEELINITKQINIDVGKSEKGLESLCLNIILHQQPVAGDFHLVSAVLKMITDMKRIGDIAEDVAELSTQINKSYKSDVMNDIVKMGQLSINMLKNTINSYIQQNTEIARNMCKSDDKVDELFTISKEKIVNIIKIDEDYADEAPDILMMAKYFERLCDHIVNMSEWVLYAFTGNKK